VKRAILLITIAVALFGCDQQPPPRSAVEAQRRQADAEVSKEQTYSYEIENIKHRRLLFGKPGIIGYVVFLNQSGQPVQYLTVSGKCTSAGKRITQTKQYEWMPYPGIADTDKDSDRSGNYQLMDGPGEDGVYGQSEPYIYCFGADGRYWQWSGDYLYSDKPFDLTIKPLVIDTTQHEQAQ